MPIKKSVKYGFPLFLLLVIGGVYLYNTSGKKIKASSVPETTQVDLSHVQEPASNYVPQAVPLPMSQPVNSNRPVMKMDLWAWNAQMGMMYANGGSVTTVGSLMDQNGVTLAFNRQDDPALMRADLYAFAEKLHDGVPHPVVGAHFVAIMGDGSAAFLQELNPKLIKAFGPEYRARVIGSAGYSRGEDKFMGLPSWRRDPQTMRGAVIAGYLMDGDWNIAIKKADDNDICNNPDPKTYNPNCLNWVGADSYTDASNKYVTGYSETRSVVDDNGKRTGKTITVKVNGVVTWTPGDVIVAQERGGLITVASTKENPWQMPNTIIGIDKWMSDNRTTVEGMLKAIFDGGDQVRLSEEALDRASQISHLVYNEKNTSPDYWKTYYRGKTERDKQGLTIELGGSKVNNLADNLHLFGLLPGSLNLFKITYETFGTYAVRQYPENVPTYPPVNNVMDTSYIRNIAARTPQMAKAEVPQFEPKARLTEVVGRKLYYITFDSGKATFTSEAYSGLNELLQSVSISGSQYIEIHGHTDNIGSPELNQQLSEERAFAVKQWLQEQSPVNFPENRITVVAHGAAQPKVPNTTEANRRQNRRVEIVIGS